MSKKLLIVESPSKCKKIEEYLGSSYKCIATQGHFRCMKNLKSIKTKTTFEPTFENDKTKEKNITLMRNTIEMYSPVDILLATDDDREGEAIAWHICQVFGLPLTTKRIIFHEITRPALLSAVQNPTQINMNLVFSQQTRQIVDMIVGFKISPLLWKYVDTKTKTLSAGRCQTPALRLIYENELNQNDTIESCHVITGFFFESLIPFVLNTTYREETETAHFLNESITFTQYTLSIIPKKECKQHAPTPFKTSTLLQAAFHALHYSPKQTMAKCQKLYQNGFITYMRTENTRYSAVFVSQAFGYIEESFGKKYVGDAADIQEPTAGKNPHEAIRITHLTTENVEDTETAALYRLIRKNTVESCMATAISENTIVKIAAPCAAEYCHTVCVPVFAGWKRYGEGSALAFATTSVATSSITSVATSSITATQQEETARLFFFRSLQQGVSCFPKKIKSVFHVESPNKHYTEGSLIQKLEQLGIGRPSTFSSIVATLLEREYVKIQDIAGRLVQGNEFSMMCSGSSSGISSSSEIIKTPCEKEIGKEKNKMVITTLGKKTIAFLLSHFNEFFSYDYTKRMEELLEDTFMDENHPAVMDENHPPVTDGGQNKKREIICKECYQKIKEDSTLFEKKEKKTYLIGDSGYELVFQPAGYVLRQIVAEEEAVAVATKYKSVKKDLEIDVQKLEAGEYSLDDLVEIKEENLGEYEGHLMKLKTGPYGAYVEWGSSRESIKSIKKPLDEIVLQDILDMFAEKKTKNESKNEKDNPRTRPTPPPNPLVLRELNAFLSIRKNAKTGKPYIFYKKKGMKTPQFFPLQHYSDSFPMCDKKILVQWIKATYLQGKP